MHKPVTIPDKDVGWCWTSLWNRWSFCWHWPISVKLEELWIFCNMNCGILNHLELQHVSYYTAWSISNAFQSVLLSHLQVAIVTLFSVCQLNSLTVSGEKSLSVWRIASIFRLSVLKGFFSRWDKRKNWYNKKNQKTFEIWYTIIKGT